MRWKRGIAILAAGASISLVPATTATAENFPSNVDKAFIKGCIDGGASRAVCKCTLRKIEKKYTLKQFERISRRVEDGGELPAAIEKMAAACQKKYGS